MGVVWGDRMQQPVCPPRGLAIRSRLLDFSRMLNSRPHARIRL
jgi:hypothetical protein